MNILHSKENIEQNLVSELENLQNDKYISKSNLEKHDIENSFTSPLKLFKSGKYYISRTNVPTRLGKCILDRKSVV